MTTEPINGPVYPVIPAFHDDESLDLDSVRSYLKYLSRNGASAFMVTVGTSRFSLLSPQECKALNQASVEVLKDEDQNNTVIVADRHRGDTETAIDFCQHASSIGADSIILYYPDRFYSHEETVDYFSTISDHTDISLILHGNPIRFAGSEKEEKMYDYALCRRLSKIDDVMGIKEESGDEEIRYKLLSNLSDELSFIVAGGSMRMYLASVLFGAQAFLTGVGSYAPQLSETFYEHCQNNEYDKALKIVQKYEEPYFDVAKPMGWHKAMRTTLDLLDLMPSNERHPLHTATEDQQNRLREVISATGLNKEL